MLEDEHSLSGTPRRSPPPPPPRSTPRRRPGRWVRRLVLLVVLLAGVFLVLGALGQFLLGGAPAVPAGSWIEIRFTESYPESVPDRTGLEGALRPTQLSAQDLGAALRRARLDDRIDGVLLRCDRFPGSWAQAQELVAHLAALQERGRQVVAYVEAPGSLDYALAAGADRILVAPEGFLAPVGLRARLSFVADTLEKVGVEADFVTVGEYKSAPEQFQEREPSPPSRRQVEAYLDDALEWWNQRMASGRGVDVDRVDDLLDRAPLDAPSAVETGWADEAVDLPTWLNRRGLERGENLVSPLHYLADSAEVGNPGPRVATVYVDGTIQGGIHGRDQVLGAIAGSETVVERLERAARDPDVAAVVLRIDSPGGSAVASDVIHRAVQRVREEKPVVASMGGSAASGGYYVAMGSDAIVADELTVTGSIGVFTGKFVLGDLYEKLGIAHATIDRGPNAGLFGELEPFTPDQRARMRERLESFYRRFVQRVADGRSLAFAQVDSVAGGRVWSGRRALDHGLVDELGGYERALAVAAEQAGLSGTPRVRTYQPRPGFYERVLQRAFETSSARPMLSLRALGPVADLTRNLRAWDGTVQYMLWWTLDVR